MISLQRDPKLTPFIIKTDCFCKDGDNKIRKYENKTVCEFNDKKCLNRYSSELLNYGNW